jgi:hypothetical protein
MSKIHVCIIFFEKKKIIRDETKMRSVEQINFSPWSG